MAEFYARTDGLRVRVARLARSVAELAYPAKCVHCGSRGQILCQDCIGRCTRLGERVCRRCSEPLVTPSLCGPCAFRPLTVSTTVALFAFDGAVRDAVHGLKYDDLRALAPLMGRLMASDPKVAALNFDTVVPVPLHPKRMQRRGYNQAHLLAKEITRSLEAPLDAKCLQRVVDTAPLARTTSRADREAGVKEAFRAGPEAGGRHILLVDDVTTTGSTLRECASALLAAGAAEVNAVVFAREV
ncbi:MAG: ComF family protein [Chloroflexi bacterium]|nr:ComF family protein [Chloroflexota bacterium]